MNPPSTLGRVALWAMIPLNLLLCLWVWFGRFLFGVAGWFLLLLIPVVLLMLVALFVTSILALTQDGRPRSLTSLQTAAHLVTSAGMLGFGFFLPDAGDTEESEISALTQLFGRSRQLLDLSYTLALVAAGVAVIGYVVLLLTLTVGRQKLPVGPRGAAIPYR